MLYAWLVSLTFLCFRHLHRHFLLLSVFDQHIIAPVGLSPNVTRLDIPFSLFLMSHSIVNDLCTLIWRRNSWLLRFNLFLLYLLLFFLLSRFQILLRSLLLHPFDRHLSLSDSRQSTHLLLILLPHRWYGRGRILCRYGHQLRWWLVLLLFLGGLTRVVLSCSWDYHLDLFRFQIVLGGRLVWAGWTWSFSFITNVMGGA